MNTRQKLTLGIAAIFMVTLTIIGVTYAYFVTRVTGDKTEDVDVKAAELASVKYNDDNSVVTLSDVLPGATVYKAFQVDHPGEEGTAPGSYSITVKSSTVDGKEQFISVGTPGEGSTETAASCYLQSKIDDEDVDLGFCKTGTSYDNVYITLYKVDGSTLPTTTVNVTGTDETVVVSEVSKTLAEGLINDQNKKYGENNLAKHDADDESDVQLLTSSPVTIQAGTTDYYILKVEYKDTNSNQNLENQAAVKILVDIK